MMDQLWRVIMTILVEKDYLEISVPEAVQKLENQQWGSDQFMEWSRIKLKEKADSQESN